MLAPLGVPSPHGRRLAVSDPEYNAARRAKGLRAVTQGLNINLDLEVAIVCLNHAADKIEELERERNEARERVKELTYENENLYRRLESVHEVYRLSSVCRELKAENEQLKQQQQ